ncbi:MAG: peptidoglycan-associated lipoprotein Pal [Nitrospirae bacterium]|nr:peptidoglycan-associated lipoprotein Pal [Nitrospirota bacterium]
MAPAASAPSTPTPTTPPAMTPSASPRFQDAFFDFEKALIKSDMKRSLQEDAQLLKAHPELAVTIGGYCDERGTDEYNLALGERRARAVQRYLTALGVKPAQLKTISYGKEKPFCTDHTEACYQQNRRGHFISAADGP